MIGGKRKGYQLKPVIPTGKEIVAGNSHLLSGNDVLRNGNSHLLSGNNVLRNGNGSLLSGNNGFLSGNGHLKGFGSNFFDTPMFF